jgi:hypothetical protein
MAIRQNDGQRHAMNPCQKFVSDFARLFAGRGRIGAQDSPPAIFNPA